MSGWNIVRTKPIAKTYGKALPIFIHNGPYFLSTIDVYSDGAIDCWGFVDRALFQSKIESDWVATQPPKDSSISVFNLCDTKVEDAHWLLSPMDIQRQVDEILQVLNPTMSGLLDMQGSAVELRNGMRYAKLGLADEKAYRLDSNGAEILGEPLPIFVKSDDGYELTQWFIFADGLTQLGNNAQLLTLAEVSQQIDAQLVTTTIPEDTWITIPGLGKYLPSDAFGFVDVNERVREAHDTLAILNGDPGSIRRCVAAHQAYEQAPTEENREQLRITYEAVPEHLRIFCGNMESKDWPIRRILYGDKTD